MERKSETQKKIEGTARKDRQIKFNSSKLEQLPKPPLTLDRHTKKIFNSILKHLNEKGALMQIDVYTVCSASIWYRVLFHYQKLVLESINDPDPKKDILIQKFKGGASNVSAEFTVLKQAQKQCDDYSIMFGLNAKSRQTIMAFANAASEESADPFEMFAKMREMKKLRKAQ